MLTIDEKERADSDIMNPTDTIVTLNVGGTKFTTSKQTMTWIADSFFTSLLSGRIPTLRDETGAIFIDRDPTLFQHILNYLRTRQIDLRDVNIVALKHEAQYYGLTPLVKRLVLCTELDQCACGDVLFHGYLPPPAFPMACQSAPATIHASSHRPVNQTSSAAGPSNIRNAGGNPTGVVVSTHSRNLSEPPILPSFSACASSGTGNRMVSGGGSSGTSAKHCLPSMEAKFQVPYVAGAVAQSSPASAVSSSYSHAVSSAYHTTPVTTARPSFAPPARGHNRASSADMKHWKPTHRSRGSTDLTRILKHELSNALKYQQEMFMDPYRVQMIRGHHNWIAVAYSHYVACYRMKDSVGWQLAYVSNRMAAAVRHIALNAKTGGPGSGAGGPGAAANGGQPMVEKLLALALSNQTINLFAINEEGISNQLGVFTLSVPVDTLFFIGGQLVALSKTGKVGIWHGMTGNWQAQDVLVPISSYDTAGSFLLLGCTNGSIYYIDMQKFPLRMKDNDLLVSELYRDPSGDAITSISVYLTPKSSLCGNWIEIAYGTSAGTVRVIVQHPETVGHSPQLFQTFAVHRAPITNVALTTNHLISVCSEYNHVRTWTVTRFRGMISTQPGSTPLASFKVLTLEAAENYGSWASSGSFTDDVGPFGDQDGDQVFVQKIVPETDQLFVRLASNGERICIVKSVDGSSIASYLVHECEGSSRMGARPRRYLFTGHSNGSIQMWDLSTGLEMHLANRERPGSTILQGPTPNELLQLIDECEITCNSLSSTPGGTPAGSMAHLPGSALS